jgi:hypothetical protein
MRIILAFQVKDLPKVVDESWAAHTRDASRAAVESASSQPAPTGV